MLFWKYPYRIMMLESIMYINHGNELTSVLCNLTKHFFSGIKVFVELYLVEGDDVLTMWQSAETLTTLYPMKTQILTNRLQFPRAVMMHPIQTGNHGLHHHVIP